VKGGATLLLAASLLVPACGEAPPRSTPSPATDRWLGRWNGPEGAYLRLLRETDEYQVILVHLDGERTVVGRGGGDRIHFERDGVRESIRATDGAGTGMKWLAGKSDCLVVRPGEGYCRD
jgi:hypothetical protein